MYATALPSDPNIQVNASRRLGAADVESAGIRANGAINISTTTRDGDTLRQRVHESGSLRVRFPHEDCPGLGAVVINTGGGMTGGDAFTIAANAAEGSILTVTTSAAEKVYRSDGQAASLNVSLKAAKRSSLAWIPQEAILFDGAKIKRHYDIQAAGDAPLLLCDINCVGRKAMGEAVSNLLLQDQWRINIDGQLRFADYTRIDGNAKDILDRPAVANGAHCFGSIIYAGPDAVEAVDYIRGLLAGNNKVDAGAGMFNGICVSRFVATELSDMRNIVTDIAQHVYGSRMPRSWNT